MKASRLPYREAKAPTPAAVKNSVVAAAALAFTLAVSTGSRTGRAQSAAPAAPAAPAARAASESPKARPRAADKGKGDPAAILAARSHSLRLKGLLKPSAPRELRFEDLVEATHRRSPAGTELTAAFKDEKPARYTGIEVGALRDAFASPAARRVRLVATNRYEQTIPLEGRPGPSAVLAFRREGKPIPPSERGSFRIVMDLDGLPDEKKEALFPYFVWSVETVEFLP